MAPRPDWIYPDPVPEQDLRLRKTDWGPFAIAIAIMSITVLAGCGFILYRFGASILRRPAVRAFREELLLQARRLHEATAALFRGACCCLPCCTSQSLARDSGEDRSNLWRHLTEPVEDILRAFSQEEVLKDVPMVPLAPSGPEEGAGVLSRQDATAEGNTGNNSANQASSGEPMSSQANGSMRVRVSIPRSASTRAFVTTRESIERLPPHEHVAESQPEMELPGYPHIEQTSRAFARFEARMTGLLEQAHSEVGIPKTLIGDRNTPELSGAFDPSRVSSETATKDGQTHQEIPSRNVYIGSQ